jgi:HAD superfamily hydrolase (TIGR01509 family)
MLPRAVVFDFDGVIADSERLHWEAFAGALRPGGHPLDWETYVAQFLPFDDRSVFTRYFAPRGGLSESALDALVSAKTALYQDAIHLGRLQPFPDALALLRACHAEGIPLAVCTSSSRHDVEDALQDFGVRPLLRTVVAAEDVSACKPDPEGYRLSIARLAAWASGLREEEAVAIEDSTGGAQAAKAAGLRLLGVSRVKTEAELRAAGADAVRPNLQGARPSDLLIWTLPTLPSTP